MLNLMVVELVQMNVIQVNQEIACSFKTSITYLYFQKLDFIFLKANI